MKGWLESVVGPDYAAALMWTIVALIVLLVLLVSIRIVRGFSTGTFIAGGRNRRARLAVLDATAIDNQRRLVLVRRDDVEHLILIGGASDLVVERDIHAHEEAAEAAPDALIGREVTPLAAEHAAPEPRPAAEARPVAQPAPQAPASRPSNIPSSQPAAAPVPDVTASRPTPAPISEPRLAQTSGDHGAKPAVPPPHEPLPPSPPAAVGPVVEPARSEPSPAPRPVIAEAGSAGSATKPAPARDDADLDDALLQELELTLEEEDRRPAAASAETARRDPDLDDEMDRLLGELSGERR